MSFLPPQAQGKIILQGQGSILPQCVTTCAVYHSIEGTIHHDASCSLRSQLSVSYAHSFKSSFISVAEIFPLFIILDRRESNCQKLVAAWGSTKLTLEIMHLIANYQEIVLFYKISDAWFTVFCDIYFF